MSEGGLPPTAKRLEAARRRGDFGQSSRLVQAAAFTAAAWALPYALRGIGRDLAANLEQVLGARGGAGPGSGADVMRAMLAAGSWLAPALGTMALVAVVVTLAQTRGQLAHGGAGRGSFADRVQGWPPAYAVMAAIVTLSMVARALWHLRAGLIVDADAPARQTLARAGSLLISLSTTGASALIACGVIDWVVQRARFARRLRMSPDEVRREQRETTGDPVVRERRSAEGRALAVAVSARDVAGATLLVWDGRGWAALVAFAEGDEAPRIAGVARGAAAAALWQMARRAGLPVVFDAELAPALGSLSAGFVPAALYGGVAAALAEVEPSLGRAHPTATGESAPAARRSHAHSSS